jgi:hypothetical protein
MSVSCYLACQAVGEGLLMSVFFGASEGMARGERERRVVDTVRPCWALAREARGRRRQEHGVVPLGDEGRVAVWHAAAGVCHVVVCDPDVNLDLAVNFLQVFSSVLAEHVKGGALETFLVKPDEALILLEKFLPCGQLLVLQNNLIKHLKKEADAIVGQKVA